MRDQQRRPARHQDAKRLVYRGLGSDIEGAGRVVEHEDARVGQQGPGEADALALTAREREPMLTDHRVVALRHGPDEPVGLCLMGHAAHLIVGRIRPAVGDVVADRGREQEGLIEHDADLAAKGVQGHVTNVGAVDAHRTALGVMEAWQQEGRGRLAGSTRSHERDGLPRGDVQVEVAQRELIGAVSEVDMDEVDRPGSIRQHDRVGCVGDARADVEQLEHPLGPGSGGLAHREDQGRGADRGDQLAEVGGEGQERADAHGSAQDKATAHGEEPDQPQRGHHLQRRRVLRSEAHVADAAAVQRAGRLLHLRQLAMLLAEALHHAHADDRLIRVGGQLGLLLLRVEARRIDPCAHTKCEQHEDRDDEQHDAEQRQRQPRHHRERQHELHGIAGEQRQEGEQLRNHRHIGVGPAHHLPLRKRVVGRWIERLEVIVDGPPQVGLDVDAHDAAEPAAQERGDPPQHGEHDQHDHPSVKRSVPGDDRPIDEALRDDRGEHDDDVADPRGPERRQSEPLVAADHPD